MIEWQKFWSLVPNAQEIYVQMFEHAEVVLEEYAVDNRLRLAHFFAQCLHETAGLSALVERLSYSPEALMKTWKTRFPTLKDALPYARNPKALAAKVYGGRMGNMNAEDAWNFRGRGLCQLTGRQNYQSVSDAMGVDFTTAPDKVILPQYGLRVAATLWRGHKCNAAADLDDIEEVTRRINGGHIGLEARKVWLEQLKEVVK